MYDVIIIGMGISGITASIYAKRAGKNVLLIDKSAPGGLLNKIDSITNYPGLPNISGPDFAINLLNQIESLKIPYKIEEVTSLSLNKNKKIVKTTTCALCDAFFYKNKDIALVGTGNSALQEALYLSNVVNKIYLINRRDGFRGDSYLVEQIKNNPKIEIIYNANMVSLNEEKNILTSITLDNSKNISVSGVFIYIGFIPATSFLDKKLLDDKGYIKVNKNFETNIKGVYAIGDCLNKDIYQLITAASDGARVINNIE